MDSNIYLVVYMDGNWRSYDPLNGPEYSLSRPDVDEIVTNLQMAMDVMKSTVDGKFVIGAHNGVYCRDIFYQEPLIGLWKKHIAQGGEVALHPHEEIVGKGTIFQEKKHMEYVVLSAYQTLLNAGIQPTAFRGGYNAYSNHVTPILERIGVGVDLSALPGYQKPEWDAFWTEAPTSAYYLCSQDYQHGICDHPRSHVLEIPMGTDAKGNNLKRNYLYNEATELDNLCEVWQSIQEEVTNEGDHLLIHFLCHLHAMGDNALRERCIQFLKFAQYNAATIVTPSEAKEIFDIQEGDRG